ncbi:host attachment family protein [Ciceribacter sp. L1K22]|uniref:host attachment family protein n=1 Tax=Ciceribacter sp. L1K22 TaxID=2820275 RepID=UPI001ABDEC11|nr:host attachment family protein [Ciceribacter sp. L1K22]MBO3759596.1 host attachment protein [Ciceribacter sp. L1K22]
MKFNIPWKSWVIVCDGAKLLLLRNEGDTEILNLAVVDQDNQPNQPDRDLAADKPGRSFASHGTGRSAMEETSFHAQAEEDFLKGVAEMLNAKVYSKEIERYVLVAPPGALGILRKSLNQGAIDAMSAELPKDLVKMPVYDIEKHLNAAKAA